jgi:hypothetical protein
LAKKPSKTKCKKKSEIKSAKIKKIKIGEAIKMFYYNILPSLSVSDKKVLNECCQQIIKNESSFQDIPTIISDVLFGKASFDKKEESSIEYLIALYKKCLICLTILKTSDNLSNTARALNLNRNTLLGMATQFKLSWKHAE